jgi:protein DEK
MATETLDDNQPSLPEKIDDPASDETKSKEAEVVAEEQDASVEVDESKDEKKQQDDADEEDDEEEEAKESDKKLKKDPVSEKKTPVTPTSDRPTRERKTVERYSEPSPLTLGRSSSSKGLVIEKVYLVLSFGIDFLGIEFVFVVLNFDYFGFCVFFAGKWYSA